MDGFGFRSAVDFTLHLLGGLLPAVSHIDSTLVLESIHFFCTLFNTMQPGTGSAGAAVETEPHNQKKHHSHPTCLCLRRCFSMVNDGAMPYNTLSNIFHEA